MRLRAAIGFTEAATHERLQRLRVVRHRPVRAEAWGVGQASRTVDRHHHAVTHRPPSGGLFIWSRPYPQSFVPRFLPGFRFIRRPLVSVLAYESLQPFALGSYRITRSSLAAFRCNCGREVVVTKRST
jgi:hypothetical protein